MQVGCFRERLESLRSDDELVRQLHMLLFGAVGTKLDRKKNLRAYSGLADKVDQNGHLLKLLEKKAWTVTLLRQALCAFGLSQGGARKEACTRLIEFLAEPVTLTIY
jgi:hypothetical protein